MLSWIGINTDYILETIVQDGKVGLPISKVSRQDCSVDVEQYLQAFSGSLAAF